MASNVTVPTVPAVLTAVIRSVSPLPRSGSVSLASSVATRLGVVASSSTAGLSAIAVGGLLLMMLPIAVGTRKVPELLGLLNVTVNGHPHATPWPFPDTLGYTWRTFAVTIPVTDLVPGTNVVQLGLSDQAAVTSNVNIVLVEVPGGVPVLPGSNNAYPGALQ